MMCGIPGLANTDETMDGPPPEPLAKVATRIEGDKVLVQA